jgi:inhibitor of cysteine peptidase
VKRQLIVAATVILVVAVGGAIGWTRVGDGGDKSGDELVVDYSQSGEEIEAAPGDVIKLTLDSNATTGFQWQLVANTNEAAVTLLDQEYVVPEESDGEPLLGAGGHEEWTFKAAAEGKSELRLEYSQPWEGGMKADKTFTLTVVVK